MKFLLLLSLVSISFVAGANTVAQEIKYSCQIEKVMPEIGDQPTNFSISYLPQVGGSAIKTVNGYVARFQAKDEKIELILSRAPGECATCSAWPNAWSIVEGTPKSAQVVLEDIVSGVYVGWKMTCKLQ